MNKFYELLSDEEIQKFKIKEIFAMFAVMTNEELKNTIQRDSNDICFIVNPSMELQALAVKTNPKALMWIDNPSEEIKFLAKLHE